MRIFLDNQLSPKIARAIDELVSPVDHAEHLRLRFAPNTADEVWLRALAAEGQWIVICGDWAMSKKERIRHIYRNSELTVFFLPDGWLEKPECRKAGDLIWCLDAMFECVDDSEPGTAFCLTARRRIYRLTG